MKKYLFLSFSIILVLASACNFNNYKQSVTKTIKYEVVGTISHADIRYTNFTGETDSITNIVLPWETHFP